jgi:hypothetical protein
VLARRAKVLHTFVANSADYYGCCASGSTLKVTSWEILCGWWHKARSVAPSQSALLDQTVAAAVASLVDDAAGGSCHEKGEAQVAKNEPTLTHPRQHGSGHSNKPDQIDFKGRITAFDVGRMAVSMSQLEQDNCQTGFPFRSRVICDWPSSPGSLSRLLKNQPNTAQATTPYKGGSQKKIQMLTPLSATQPFSI